MLLEKDISRVNIGSYVVRIIKQRGTNKELLNKWIEDLHTIENLIDLGVERVLIDTNKVLPEHNKDSNLVIPDLDYNPPKLEQSFAEQLVRAKEMFDRATSVQADMLEELTNGRPLNLKIIQLLITELSEKTYDNSDALLCILNLRLKQRYQIEHAVAATILILVFSQFLGIERTIASELALGAFIHDAGKVFIDDSIINRPGEVSAEEFEVIKSHVNQSINIIKSTYGIPKLSLQVVAQHHEKLDGSGYPKGFDERVISKYARMLAICDIYDALTTEKVYKDKHTQVQAFAMLMEMANDNLLDMTLVNQFIKCLGVYPIGSLVKLNNEQLAIVESRQPNKPLKPRVRVLYNTRQGHFINSIHIDLSDEKNLEIERVVEANEFGLEMNKIIEFVIIDG